MTNFSKRNDPKIIPHLNQDHASGKSVSDGIYKPTNFNRKDSSSFHEPEFMNGKNINVIPDYSKYRNKKVTLPKEEYTEEEVLLRPIHSKEAPLKIEGKEKEMPDFTKGMIDPMNEMNPVDELFQQAKTTSSKIEEPPVMKKMNPPKRTNKFIPWIIVGIILELIILAFIYVVRDQKSKQVLECFSETYSSYYEAKIMNTKRYYFKRGKIEKLEDTVQYVFEEERAYEEFKQNYANPPYAVVDGRKIVFNINDNDLLYEEKATYDYPKLRKKSISADSHNIEISTDVEDDRIYLVDYNITDIKIIYQDDYVCR